MTGAGVHHRLTGGGEAALLIDYRLHLCIQGCCCCCSCRDAAAAAAGELVVAVVAVASNKQSSTCFLSHSPSFFPWPSPFPPFTPLIAPSFPSLAPPAPSSRRLARQQFNIFNREGCEPSLEERWIMMNGAANRISLSLLPAPLFSSLFGQLFFTWSRLCCL